jgi:hypothetical protein
VFGVGDKKRYVVDSAPDGLFLRQIDGFHSQVDAYDVSQSGRNLERQPSSSAADIQAVTPR